MVSENQPFTEQQRKFYATQTVKVAHDLQRNANL